MTAKTLPKEMTILNHFAQAIFDQKGFNILGLDVRDISTITDYVIIAEGNVDRHTISIAKEVIESAKQMGLTSFRTQGIETGDWIVIDFYDIMVHIFTPGLREKYHLEGLWQDAQIIDFKFS